MIPDGVGPNTSAAEKDVFDRVRGLAVPGLTHALHGLHLPEHERKRVTEADFVLVGPAGVFVLEVKGGAVSRRRGIWHFEDLRGKRRKFKESPFEQAEGAMFALNRLLRERMEPDLVDRTVFGYGVVFPHCDLAEVDTVEWSQEMVIDRRSFDEDGGAAALASLCSYWEAKPGRRRAVSEDEADWYLQVLRPDFDRVPTLRQLADSVEGQLVSLTERQYRGLDGYRQNERLVLEGGAGTGKTMLAVEICRRAAASGRSALLTCRSTVLASFLRVQDQIEEVTVMPFERLRALRDQVFDLVVVDEAQDVVNGEDLGVLEGLLKGGFADGEWVFLLDSNNQRGLVGRYEEQAMRQLRSHRPAHVQLVDNCRNTTEIVRATQERTGADLGVTTAGRGPEVMAIDGSRDEVRREITSLLETLEQDDIAMEEVVFLSARPFNMSIFAELPDKWRARTDVLDVQRLRLAKRGRIGFARVADFKGLESPFVIVEVDGAETAEQTRTQLYVGMTRARVGLWIASPLDSSVSGASALEGEA